MIVFVFSRETAAAMYRCMNPATVLKKSGFNALCISDVSVSTLLSADILIFYARYEEYLPEIIRTALQLGKKVYYSMDDPVWDLPWGWLYEELSKKAELKGTLYSIEFREFRLQVLSLLHEIASYGVEFIVSTEELAREVERQFDTKAHVLHNFCLYKEQQKKEGKSCFYPTSSEHLLYDSMPLKKIKAPVIVVGGKEAEFNAAFAGCSNFIYFPTMSTIRYYHFVEGIDAKVGLAPLNPSLTINRCKSCVKLLEFAKFGMTAVASPVGEYAKAPVVFAEWNDDWDAKVRKAMEKDPEELRKWAEQWNYNAIQEWLKFFANA